jgi:glycosyltransferase involved in cell wall biosynthesis
MISIAIPTYNRYEMTIQCFEQVLYDDRIDEVVIVDDCSEDNSYDLLKERFRYDSKVKLHRNSTNFDCFLNKRMAIDLASNDWCILFDSDNVLDSFYLDLIFDYAWNENVIFQPAIAYPNFNFEAYSGLSINKNNVANYIDMPMFETMLNAQNFFVNRKSYIGIWHNMRQVNPVTSDSIWFNYNWLKDGKEIFVVPNLCYYHRVHEGSHYKNNVHKTPSGFHEQILQSIRELK